MATPAEERSDETPQELATRRLSASSAESVRLERRIRHNDARSAIHSRNNINILLSTSSGVAESDAFSLLW